MEEEIQKGEKISPKSYKEVYYQILYAIGIIIYFFITNYICYKMGKEKAVSIIEMFATAFFIIGLIVLEIAYKKDSGKMAITAIELLIISFYSITIMHIVTKFKFDFQIYLLTSSYIIAIYYVLKAIVVYTKERREYLNSFSDIKEIVKKDEPAKKTATKTVGKTTKKNNNEPAKKTTSKSNETSNQNNEAKKQTKTIKNVDKISESKVKETKVKSNEQINKNNKAKNKNEYGGIKKVLTY